MIRLLLIIASFSIALSVTGQTNLSLDQQDVQKTVTEMFQALADRKVDKMKEFCTPDIMILESGAVWNLDTLVRKVNRPGPKDYKRVNKIDFISTEVKGNIAWTTCHNLAEVTAQGITRKILWLETSILIKENGRWRIQTLHSTTIKRE